MLPMGQTEVRLKLKEVGQLDMEGVGVMVRGGGGSGGGGGGAWKNSE